MVVRALERARSVNEDGHGISLTEREPEPLCLLDSTLSVGELAVRPCVSVSTVKSHRANLYRNLVLPRGSTAHVMRP